METQLFAKVLENGLAGVVIIVLALVIKALWGKYNEVQEKRISESRESVKAVEQNTATLETLTEVLRAQGRTGQ